MTHKAIFRRTLMAAAAFALPGAALAQTTASSGTSSPTTGDVSAGTSSYGTTDQNSLGVGGTAEAQAADGGTASTSGQAKLNDRRGMTSSRATARDDDEQARSQSRTIARKDGVVRSRSRTFYHEKGEKPVITRDYSVSGGKRTPGKAE